jgi:predicted enzyme related to lactoylglutathione lyase
MSELTNSEHIIGIGGVFIRAKDKAATNEWYAKVLGIPLTEWGASFYWFESKVSKHPHLTNWSVFAQDADYFGNSDQAYMINYIVKDLEGLLAKMNKQGTEEVKPMEKYDYGKFAWVNDNEGRRIELWEPMLGDH